MSTFTFRFTPPQTPAEPRVSSSIPDRIFIGKEVSLYQAVDTVLAEAEKESFNLIAHAKNSNKFR